jgi:hypothetical protein
MGGGRRVAGRWETTQQLAVVDKNKMQQEVEAEGRASWQMWCLQEYGRLRHRKEMQHNNQLAAGGVFDNGANIGIVFAVGVRGISPVNLP